MAISGSFKQQCPSCEANVLVKDGSLIGKKVDCPKCKYRFVVEDPVAKDKKKVAADTVSAKKKDTAVTNKKKPAPVEDEVLDVDVEEDDAPAKATSGKRRRDEEDDEPETRKPKKKKKQASGGNNKRLIGLALGGVGLIVLAAAAYFLIGGESSPKTAAKGGKGTTVAPKGKGAVNPGDGSAPDGTPNDNEPKAVILPQGGPASLALTNFLPSNSEGVYHCHFKDFLESLLGKTAVTTPGAITDAEFKQRLGISILNVDDILTAESYSENWTFHVIHVTGLIKDMRPLIQAMDLKEWKGNSTKHKCYELNPGAAAWVLALTKLPLFVPAHMLTAQAIAGRDRPLLLHMRDAQTLIFAHPEPMLAYLQAHGNIEPNKANVTSGKKFDTSGDPFQPDGFLTINPALRDVLHHVATGKEGKVLVSSATDLRMAAVRGKNLESAGRVVFRVRPFWDVVNILDEKTNRIENVGLALVMKDQTHLTFSNSLTCNTNSETQQLHDDLLDNVGWRVAQFFEKTMAHKVEVFYDDGPPPVVQPAPGPTPPQQGFIPPGEPKKQPPPKKVEPRYSYVKAIINDKTVDFTLSLALSGDAPNSMRTAVQLMAIGLKGEADAATGKVYPFQLAEAGKTLGEKGLSKRSVPPETFPPGAFPRQPSEMWNAREPGQRVSWMAGLLPYLGQDTLYGKINFNLSWRDGPNWLPAHTLVPQFLDPTYPAFTRYVTYPGMPLSPATTHFVGISGVGVDSADYPAGDPALVGKLGIFGYNRMTPLATIKDKGRGLENTVLLIRVPFDGNAGVTPWMAGGGSTVRSVPEKNSLAPFLSLDAKGAGGTVVLMADGSVRVLQKGMSDAAFKAICTIDGPTPEGLKLDENSPKIEPVKEEPRPPLKDAVPVPPGTGSGKSGGGGGGIASAPQTMPAGWKLFTHQEGGFLIGMPESAVPFVRPNPEGELHGFEVASEPGKNSYSAGFQKIRKEVKSNPDQFVNDFKMNLEASGSPVTKENKITYEKNAGRELIQEIETPTGKGMKYTRLYFVNDRLYVVTLAGPGLNSRSAEYTSFFNSFRLIGAK